MQTTTLGNSTLTVPRIGLGTMGMSEFYGDTNEAESIATLHEALAQGINFWDTADMYGIGHNEELLAKAMQGGKRQEVVLATKFGIMRANGQFVGLNGKPEYVRQACEASLKRLQTDVIDLYYLHRVDPQTPIEETVGAMAELVREGKVRYLGLSEVSGETLHRAHKIHPISAVQSEYSLWSTDIEESTLPACRALGTSLVAYSPLGRGFLTGEIKSFDDLAADDYRRFSPRFQGDNFQKNLDLVAQVGHIAEAKGVKASQIALAWLLAKGNDIVPIPGTKRIKYLLENIAALHISLSPDEIASLDALNAQVSGTRYDARGMSIINA